VKTNGRGGVEVSGQALAFIEIVVVVNGRKRAYPEGGSWTEVEGTSELGGSPTILRYGGREEAERMGSDVEGTWNQSGA